MNAGAAPVFGEAGLPFFAVGLTPGGMEAEAMTDADKTMLGLAVLASRGGHLSITSRCSAIENIHRRRRSGLEASCN